MLSFRALPILAVGLSVVSAATAPHKKVVARSGSPLDALTGLTAEIAPLEAELSSVLNGIDFKEPVAAVEIAVAQVVPLLTEIEGKIGNTHSLLDMLNLGGILKRQGTEPDLIATGYEALIKGFFTAINVLEGPIKDNPALAAVLAPGLSAIDSGFGHLFTTLGLAVEQVDQLVTGLGLNGITGLIQTMGFSSLGNLLNL